jgi:hypothetical protein
MTDSEFTTVQRGNAPTQPLVHINPDGNEASIYVNKSARTRFLPDEEITEAYYRSAPGRMRIIAGRAPEESGTYAVQDSGAGLNVSATVPLKAAGVITKTLDNPDPRPCVPVEGATAIEFSVEDLLDD